MKDLNFACFVGVLLILWYSFLGGHELLTGCDISVHVKIGG